MPASGDSSSILSQVGWAIRKLCWTLSILSSVAAGASVGTHSYAVRGGRQQTAVAVLRLFFAFVPYAVARGVSDLGS